MRRIGLLGGSFNPAHEGHRHISLLALQLLELDEIWWLVSPQNPLKPAHGMAPLPERVAGAAKLARHPRIKVTAVEGALGTRYTADTLRSLRRRFPATRFVWLMGADNLVQLRHWGGWKSIFRTAAVAVFDRPSYSLRAMASLPASRFSRARVRPNSARHLASMALPAWVFFPSPLDPLSATEIRSSRAAGQGQPDDKRAATRLQPDLLAEPSIPAPIPPQLAANATGGSEARSILDIVYKTLDDGKAEDILVIDLRGRSSVTDHWVIASGSSSRQVVALAEHVASNLKSAGHGRIPTEGTSSGDWVLIDAGDVVVHLFRPEVRRFYNLEKIWGVEPSVPAAPYGEEPVPGGVEPVADVAEAI